MTSRYRRDALSVAHSTGWELRPTSEGQLSVFQHTAPHPPCTHGLEDSGRTIRFWDICPTDRVRCVPRCFQVSDQVGNQLETGTVNGFPIHPGSHVPRLRCDTLVCQEPQVDIVQLLKELIELNFWFFGHCAKYRKQRVWLLHCVLLFRFLPLENLRPFALYAAF